VEHTIGTRIEMHLNLLVMYVKVSCWLIAT